MKDLTSNHPKCMLKLNGKTIIEHQIDLLVNNGINNINIITGYKQDKIVNLLKDKCSYYFYPNFKETNNLYTINHHLDILDDECLILFSDVLISDKSMKTLLNDNNDFSLLVDISKCDESTMRIVLDENKIVDIGSHISPNDGSGNFIGIAKFSLNAASSIKKKIMSLCINNKNINDYYTKAISELAKEKTQINFVDIDGLPWVEIDTKEEYILAIKQDFYIS